MIGNSGSMIQIQRDKICKAPVYTNTLFNRINNIKKWRQNRNIYRLCKCLLFNARSNI